MTQAPVTQAPGLRTPARSRSSPLSTRPVALLAALLPALLATCVRPELPVSLPGPTGTYEWVDSPRSLAEMRSLENVVVDASQLAIEATVAIRVGENQGSGVIVSEDGLVLTAWHVISRAYQPATIVLSNGQRLRGTTLESNPTRDSGMIRIDAPGPFPYVDVLEEGDAPIGTWCLATGHPGGYETGRPPVLRVGRVVAHRSGFLQSDCPIFSGDSGGPLFDLEGRVIGIHSRIRENLSFNLHVPASVFVRDWNFLVADGPLLGIQGEDHPGGGARVTLVLPDLPAHAANLLPGDVILRFGGQPVESMETLVDLVATSRIGERIALTVRRGEREFVVEPRLVQRGAKQ